jgi:hypothetical protein
MFQPPRVVNPHRSYLVEKSANFWDTQDIAITTRVALCDGTQRVTATFNASDALNEL